MGEKDEFAPQTQGPGASGESSSELKTGQERKLNEIGGDKRGITELNCAKLQY